MEGFFNFQLTSIILSLIIDTAAFFFVPLLICKICEGVTGYFEAGYLAQLLIIIFTLTFFVAVFTMLMDAAFELMRNHINGWVNWVLLLILNIIWTFWTLSASFQLAHAIDTINTNSLSAELPANDTCDMNSSPDSAEEVKCYPDNNANTTTSITSSLFGCCLVSLAFHLLKFTSYTFAFFVLGDVAVP